MTHPDYRALCAELLDELDMWSSWHDAPELKARAKEALAQPEPVGPTAVELRNLWLACNSPSVFARAVLQRWGRH